MIRKLCFSIGLFLCAATIMFAQEYIDIIPESRVIIDVPNNIDTKKNTLIIFYALPNGNSIEWTMGKKLSDGDDWHFNIQHIKAQTVFVRNADTSKNYIVVYLESSTKAWTTHAAKYQNSYELYPHLVDSVCKIIASEHNIQPKNQNLMLSCHSGGGRFVFNYIAGIKNIPTNVTRIAFIDANYGWQETPFADIIFAWMKISKHNYFNIIAYDDFSARLNGKPFVSETGGTGYRAKCAFRDLEKRGIKFRTHDDNEFTRYIALKGRLQISIKKNPNAEIFHTVLVERNGFIESVFFGTKFESKNYKFWSDRAYIVTD